MRQARGSKGTDGIRLIFEWLGLTEPERGRREPVALPAWAPIAVATAGALLGGLLIVAVRALLG